MVLLVRFTLLPVIPEDSHRFPLGRVRLARHATTGKMAAIKILNIHPNLSSRSSALASAGAKAEKMMLTAEREIAVMKVIFTIKAKAR